MKDKYEHIHMATDDRLAEMIDLTNSLPFDEWVECLAEACRRLKARKKTPFNHEQFE